MAAAASFVLGELSENGLKEGLAAAGEGGTSGEGAAAEKGVAEEGVAEEGAAAREGLVAEGQEGCSIAGSKPCTNAS